MTWRTPSNLDDNCEVKVSSSSVRIELSDISCGSSRFVSIPFNVSSIPHVPLSLTCSLSYISSRSGREKSDIDCSVIIPSSTFYQGKKVDIQQFATLLQDTQKNKLQALQEKT